MHLARKITLPLALAAFVALGFSAWLSVQEAVALHHADIERQQSVAGRVLLAALERERARGSLAEAAPLLLAAANTDVRTQMRLIPVGQLELTQGQQDQLARGEAVFDLDVWHSAETWLPTTLADGTAGALWVQESLDSERTVVRRIVWSHVLNFGTLGLLWAGVAIGLGAVVVGRPMRALAEKARRVSKGDYSGPVHLAQSDEIGQLATEMNHMCDELLASQVRIQREVDAREKAQDALRHADRLTTVGLLAAGIAHELGTPLNVVSMRARMIATGEVSGDEVKTNADIIHQQSAQMTRIIRQLLDFARRRQPSLTRFALDQVAGGAVSMLAPLAEKSRVTLELTAGPRVEIDGDPDQLQQVITNLVINGVQAMPEGGEIHLGLARTRATPPADMGGPEGDYVRLDVRDQGSGIAPDVLPRIFEPFFTTKPVGDGNGLGLPVAWGIVKDHRGWIAVETKAGVGTTFSLFLPLPSESHPA
jgi:signal transduction histidine kinase